VPARDPGSAVDAFHDQSKHHVNRFARSSGYLDWATQPNPFRSFDGAPRIDLVAPFRTATSGHSPGSSLRLRSGQAAPGLDAAYDDLFVDSSPRIVPGLEAVSVFFRYSLGLSAWKQAGGSRWALRVNPSSGNLHPTEGYAVLGPGVVSHAPGVYHYAPDVHGLEQRCLFSPEAWDAVMGALPAGAFLAGLTSIHWREAWKYGERAFRYCQHDVGHAIAAMRMAAALMGWRLRVLPDCSHAALARVLGTDREGDFGEAEPEEPACLCVVWPGPDQSRDPDDVLRLGRAVATGAWTGRANQLSASRVQWDAIDAVADASRAPGGARRATEAIPKTSPVDRPTTVAVASAASLLLQRRSAVAMDGHSTLARDRFLMMLRRILQSDRAPWDALWWEPRVHLVLFVHRVDGFDPGIYALARTTGAQVAMQRLFRSDFAWVRPPGVDDDIPLCLLAPRDVRRISRQLSCAQDIAADGFFSLGMLADFDAALAEHGSSFYRHLFWEAGAIGQILYLEAEAAGARGTGIGCFFDDAVHEVLGITDHQFQSLYHFTVGMPVDDPRLQTLPGYSWEARMGSDLFSLSATSSDR
jgi:SagB-type dehydrogenase family enzyme